MKMRLAVGSTVLNQTSEKPMSGEVISLDPFRVRWSDGMTYEESPSDVILTADCVWEIDLVEPVGGHQPDA